MGTSRQVGFFRICTPYNAGRTHQFLYWSRLGAKILHGYQVSSPTMACLVWWNCCWVGLSEGRTSHWHREHGCSCLNLRFDRYIRSLQRIHLQKWRRTKKARLFRRHIYWALCQLAWASTACGGRIDTRCVQSKTRRQAWFPCLSWSSRRHQPYLVRHYRL